MKVVVAKCRNPRVPDIAERTPAQLRTNAAWLRDELESLDTRIKFGPGILDLAAIVRAHAAIRAGEDFRMVLK